MRSKAIRLLIFSATSCAALTLPIGGAALCPADTLYVLPTASTVVVPASYSVSSSYLLPSAYAVPTYYPTAYYSTAYYPTAYYPTTYYPTVYYPTAYYADTVAASPSYYETIYERRGLFGRRRWVVERPL